MSGRAGSGDLSCRLAWLRFAPPLEKKKMRRKEKKEKKEGAYAYHVPAGRQEGRSSRKNNVHGTVQCSWVSG